MVVVVTTLVWSIALSADSSPLGNLDAAHAAYDRFDYTATESLLREGLATTKEASPRVALLGFLAEVLILLERNDEARDAFAEILRIDPAFELPITASPKLHEQLKRTRTQIQVKAATKPDARARRGEPPVTQLAATQPSAADAPWYTGPLPWVIGAVALVGGVVGIVAAASIDNRPPHFRSYLLH